MKVKLIPESSGFGYSGKIVNWIVESDENLGKLQKLQKGNTVEIPEKIAKSIYNLVNVETGEIISYNHSVFITTDEVIMKHKEQGKEEIVKTREVLKEVFTEKVKIKPLDIIKEESDNDSNIESLNEENE
jgi:hypothetical protein